MTNEEKVQQLIETKDVQAIAAILADNGRGRGW
jgi:hypothetical protein